ncbi:hypothetical protein ACPA9J_28405 [Pseudomonas aeruginosa]
MPSPLAQPAGCSGRQHQARAAMLAASLVTLPGALPAGAGGRHSLGGVHGASGLGGWPVCAGCSATSRVAALSILSDGWRRSGSSACHWLGDVLLRLEPERPCAIAPGSTYCVERRCVARPIRWPACPHEDPWLEFHIDCSSRRSATAPGARRLARSCVWASCAAGVARYERPAGSRPLLADGRFPTGWRRSGRVSRALRARTPGADPVAGTWRAATTRRASWRVAGGHPQGARRPACRRRSCPLPWPISALFRGAA